MDIININQVMPQDVFQVLTKVSLESLSMGDILRGRVQSLESGMLLIKLLDGKSFTAAVPEGFSANEGEPITLKIGQYQNNQLTAKIISLGSKPENGADKQALLSSTIEASLKSLGVINAKELVDNVMELLNAKPELNPEQASFLVANKLSGTPNMDEILLKISEHEFSLHKNLEDLQGGITEAFFNNDSQSAAKALAPIIIKQEANQLSDQIRDLLPELSPKVSDSVIQNIKGFITKTLMDEFIKPDNKSHINKNDLETLVKNAISTAEDNSNDKQLSLPSKTMEDVLKLINRGLRQIHGKADKISNSPNSDSLLKEIKPVLDKLFEKAFIRAENGIIEPIDIKEKTEALKDILELAQKVLTDDRNAAKELNLPALKELDTAFKFFEQVTTYNSILQLPIKINQENATGELYVMKRKNSRRKIDTSNFTLFLSLSTNTLGLVESFLNATNRLITVRFRLEEEELVNLFNDNYMHLYDGLLDKGFTLVDMKCRLIDNNRANVLNANTEAEKLLGTESRLDLKI